MAHVAIVGGGITGLSAAHALIEQAVRRGLDVRCTVIEADSRFGGKVLTDRSDGLVLEGGPDAILTRKPWAVGLCRRLGLERRLVPTASRGAFVWWRGSLLPLPEGVTLLVPTKLAPFVRTPLLSPAGKARMAAEYFVPRKSDGADESLGDFVRRRMGTEALERLAEPLLSGIYAGDVDALSLKATFPQFAKMEAEHGSLIRATLAARKKGESGKQAPGDVTARSVFVSLEGGIQTLVEALVGRLSGQRLIAGKAVTRIRRIEATGEYALELGDGERLVADAVVMTAPAFALAELLAEVSPGAAARLREIEYASVAGVVLVYPKAAVRHPLNGTGYVVPRAARRTVTACTWASRKWPHVAGEDRVVFRCHFGKAGGEDVTAWSDARLTEEAVREVRETLGVEGTPQRVRIFRWPHAIPQYQVGHLERIAEVERHLERTPGLVATGAAFRGVGVPDCVRQGEEAAEKILQLIQSRRRDQV